MKKYEVQLARIEHHVYLIEVDAENEEQAQELALEQFTGDEEYRIVHAEEFINGIEEVAP
jgi:hypothetical protein